MTTIPTRNYKNICIDFAIPIIILVTATAVFWNTNYDIEFESLFFNESQGGFNKRIQPWYTIYKCGPIIPLSLAIIALLTFIGGFFVNKLKQFRTKSLFMALMMIIGPGLIVNSIFKEHWGRPRPREIKEFKGSEDFVHPFVKGPFIPNEGHIRRLNTKTGLFWDLVRDYYPMKGKHVSFPSGHAAVAFFMFCFYFMYRRSKYRWLLFILGLGSGALMGLARNAQGGHFPSDVVWAGCIVYLTGLTLYYLLSMDKQNNQELT